MRLALLMKTPEWECLQGMFTHEVSELNAIADNDRKSAPERINAIERRKGIELVLNYPTIFTGWADEYLKESSGRSLEEYMERLKEDNHADD
jgi:hypothetical protein